MPQNSEHYSRIEESAFVPAELDAVWALAASSTGLVELTPKIFGLILKKPGEIKRDQRIHLGVKIPGIPLSLEWIAHIIDCEDVGAKRFFVDLQEQGPFVYYRHQHIFEHGKSGTWVRDIVEFKAPFWYPAPLAAIALKVLIRGRHAQLRRRLT